jgi:2-polyprenyl-3-methyl-5-hydroxy-6-metoxy-1,4-benzoquinol methylase
VSSPGLREPRAIDVEDANVAATGIAGPNAHVTGPCPGCGGTRFGVRCIAAGLSTFTCESCGLILSSMSRRKPKMGQYANVDLRAYLSSVGALRQEQSSAILAFLRSHARAGARVLDVGCGFGSFLIQAKEAGYEVAGIEPDADACAGACKILGEGAVRQGTLHDLQPPDGSADVVATLDVLEHVPVTDQATFAALTANALSPGGLWLIKVPSTEGLYYKTSSLMARVAPTIGVTYMRRLWQTDYEFPHTVYFNRHSLRTWLRRHGFTLIAHRYLPEVPTSTIIDRLTHDGDISHGLAYAMVPAVYVINAIEWLRRRSDALVVLARRDSSPTFKPEQQADRGGSRC